MQKAFDVSDLENRLKANGIPAVEVLAEVAANQVFAWLKDSFAMEAATNPLFAIGVPILSALQPAIMAEIKKIIPVSVPVAPVS